MSISYDMKYNFKKSNKIAVALKNALKSIIESFGRLG